MTHTKSTLGRVLARYYNWYGMTERLRAYLKRLGWTEERIRQYDKANHLTVSPDHKGENPKVPAPSDTTWLKVHKPLPGRAKPPWKRGVGQPAAPKKPHWYRPGTVALCEIRRFPEVNEATNKEAPIPEAGAGDCPRHERKAELCQWGNPGTAGGSRSVSRQLI